MQMSLLTMAQQMTALTDSDRYGPDAEVRLIVEPFTPTAYLEVDDLTYASFDGGEPKAPDSNPQNITSPSTGMPGLLLREPAGGFNYVCSGTTDLPQTVYGWAVIDSGGLLAFCDLLDEPVVISEVGDFVTLSAILGYNPIPYFSPE